MSKVFFYLDLQYFEYDLHFRKKILWFWGGDPKPLAWSVFKHIHTELGKCVTARQLISMLCSRWEGRYTQKMNMKNKKPFHDWVERCNLHTYSYWKYRSLLLLFWWSYHDASLRRLFISVTRSFPLFLPSLPNHPSSTFLLG